MTWTADFAEVLEFGHVLVDTGELDTADETLYYFEKPHKWQTVRDAWEAAGRPRDSSDTGWDAFLHELEELAGL
jgi:hypothetical protein